MDTLFGEILNSVLFLAYKDAVSKDDASQAKKLLNTLIEDGIPMIEACARRLAQRDYEDLRQAGMIGYAAALRTHKEDLGPFEGWARRWIRSEQNKVIETRAQMRTRSRWGAKRSVVLPSGETVTPSAVRRAAQAIKARTGVDATAEDLGVDPDQLESWTVSAKTESEYAEDDDDMERPAHLENLANVPDSEPFLLPGVTEALRALDERARRIVFFVVIEGKSLREIGQEENLCHIRVRAIYLNALKKLQQAITNP